MMQTIRISRQEHQQIFVTVSGQNVVIQLRTIGSRLYFSMLNQDGNLIVANSLCQPYAPLVRMDYKGFVGDFALIPEGKVRLDDEITWDKLSTVYQLVYDETGKFEGMGNLL